jgi:hypothetical protein
MGVRKKMKMGRAGGYKLSPREWRKTLQIMQSRRPRVSARRRMRKSVLAAMNQHPASYAFGAGVAESLPK